MADHRTVPQAEAAISDAIASIHRHFYGKGPLSAKTYMQGDFVFCVLSDPFTTVEQTLIEVGRRADVRAMRQAFQDAMTVKFSRAVREITGRSVIAFMSQSHVGPDVAVEIFQLGELTGPDAV